MDPDKLYLLRVSCAYDSWSTSGLKNLKKLPQRQLTKKSVNFCRGEKNGIFPAISVNKGCHSHWQLQPPGWLTVEPWGNSGKKRIPAIQQPWDYRHSLWWTLKKLRMWKYMILAPDSWGTYQRQDFREPRLLHLPIHRKVLNSLTWDIWFSFIYNDFLMLRLPALCCKITTYPISSPFLLEEFLRALWKFISWTVLCSVAQSCLTLWSPMNCRLPGFSVYGNSPGKNTGVGCHPSKTFL